MSLPHDCQVEVACRQITDGPEPKTYETRRPILERILHLRMTYYDSDLEIES